MNELQEATIDQLIDELNSRFASMVFGGVRDAVGDPDSEDFVYYRRGGGTIQIGIVARLRLCVARDVEREAHTGEVE